MQEIRHYKVKTLPSASSIKPNSVYYVKATPSSDVLTYITDITGIPFPLRDLSSVTPVQSLSNLDGTITVTGATNIIINISASTMSIINSALQNGDNVSELNNDVGYVVSTDLPNTKVEFNTALTDGDFLFVGDITQYTDEQAQDAIGSILVDTATIDLTYNDVTPKIEATVKNNSITAQHLANNINISEFVNDENFIDHTDLGYTASPTNGIVTSDTGTDATIPLAGLANAGLLSASEKATIASALQTVDLGYTASPTDGIVTNTGGTDSTLPLADATNAGLFSPAEKANLANQSNINSGDDAPNATSNAYADSLVVSIFRPAGSWDASGNTFPTIGTGLAGAIREGDTYNTSVLGTPTGFETLDVGDNFYSLINNPGQTASNWARFEVNTQQSTESFRGTAKIATQVIIEDETTTNDIDIVTPKKFWQGWTKGLTLTAFFSAVRNTIVSGFNSSITWDRVTTSSTIQDSISLLQKQSNYLQTTRFISGTGVTINVDPTKFDIQVVGEIVDPITFIPTTISVNLTAQTTTYLATQVESYVWVNSAGIVVQSLIPPLPTDLDSVIGYWVLVHSNLTNINVINSFPYYTDGTGVKVGQILNYIGFSKFPNTNIATAGTTGTRLVHTGGFAIKSGLGNTTKRPVAMLIGATDPSNMEMRHRNGVQSSGIQNIDVTNYNPTGSTVSALANNRFGVHKIWKFSSGLIRIQYGQHEYQNYNEAILGLTSDSFVDEGNAFRNGMHIGWLVFKKGTSWGSGGTGVDGIDYKFVDVKSNGSTGGLTPTLQAAYDVSTQPQITTATDKGALQVKRGSLADTDSVIEALNGAGTVTASIKGNGTTLIGTTTDNGVDKLQINGSVLIADVSGTPMLIEASSTGGLFGINTYGGSGATSSGGLVSRFARGTKLVPLDVALGDRLGYNLFGGWAGGAFRHTAGINAMVDATGTVSATSLPSYFAFFTTANGSVTRGERMRITSAGNLLIGTTTDDAVNKVQVNGSVLLPTTGYFKFGGNTSSFPAIGKLGSGNYLGAFAADGSNYVSFGAQSLAAVADVSVGSGGAFNFLSTASNRLQSGTVDTGLSRISAGVVGVGNGSVGSQTGHIIAGEYRLATLNTAPTSATDTGILGEIRYDANYIYLCVATNTWKRSALTTW